MSGKKEVSMKRRLVISFSVVVSMLLLFCSPGYVVVNAKTKNHEKLLRQELMVKDRYIYGAVTVQKGKYYTLRDFLKVCGTKYNSAGELLKQIKNNSDIVCSGKGLKIKNDKFMAKNTGEYKLKIRTGDEFHIFSLRVVEPYYPMQPDRVSKILISQKTLGKTTEVEITDPDRINGVKSELMQTKYAFDFTESMKRRVGFGGYYVALYDAGGHLLQQFSLTSDTLGESGAMWKSGSESGGKCFGQIDQMYKEAVSLVPEKLR